MQESIGEAWFVNRQAHETEYPDGQVRELKPDAGECLRYVIFVGQSFGARVYFVSTAGRDEGVIRVYVRNRESMTDDWSSCCYCDEARYRRWCQRPGLISVPDSTALNGSHHSNKAVGLARRYLLLP